MLPLIYKVNDIKRRLTEIEGERRKEIDSVLNGGESAVVCDYPSCMCGMYGLPCKKKRK